MKKCSKCGASNPDNVDICVLCGYKFKEDIKTEEVIKETDISFEKEKNKEEVKKNYTSKVMRIPNYLVGAILVTIFCCLPLGIVAIIKSAEVNTKISNGDIEGALKASAMVRRMIIFSILAWVIVVISYFLFIFLTVIPASR